MDVVKSSVVILKTLYLIGVHFSDFLFNRYVILLKIRMFEKYFATLYLTTTFNN